MSTFSKNDAVGNGSKSYHCNYKLELALMLSICFLAAVPTTLTTSKFLSSSKYGLTNNDVGLLKNGEESWINNNQQHRNDFFYHNQLFKDNVFGGGDIHHGGGGGEDFFGRLRVFLEQTNFFKYMFVEALFVPPNPTLRVGRHYYHPSVFTPMGQSSTFFSSKATTDVALSLHSNKRRINCIDNKVLYSVPIQSLTKLYSSKTSQDSESLSPSSQQHQRSLADMEDAVEQTLESNQPLNFSVLNNSNNNNNDNQNIQLQHTMRAPTTSSSSSNTFGMQELSFESEDEEARKRQSFINSYLEKDDEDWKRERLEKILGKYKDVLFGDDDENDGGGGDRAARIEEKWRQIIEEEKLKIENGTFLRFLIV